MRKDDPLARKEAIERDDLLSIPLCMPRREIVQDHIAGWFGVDRNQLNVFAGHNLLNNVALLAEAGLCYVICVGGAFEIRGGENLCFVPLSPEQTTGHVLAWKKNRVFHSAADRFRCGPSRRMGSSGGKAGCARTETGLVLRMRGLKERN